MNKNMSASYKEAYGQIADPQMGCRMPAGKPDDEVDALKQAPGKSNVEAVKDAQEVKGAAKMALDKQLGRNTPSGGRLGDATNHPNSGGEADSESDARE